MLMFLFIVFSFFVFGMIVFVFLFSINNCRFNSSTLLVKRTGSEVARVLATMWLWFNFVQSQACSLVVDYGFNSASNSNYLFVKTLVVLKNWFRKGHCQVVA
uniref:Uncharacterized protein n=1 Tax=Cacopsylla melanoneura TaxID=428564 RepID=A0A8D8SW93_9HEMI